jgi:hypothetical protein
VWVIAKDEVVAGSSPAVGGNFGVAQLVERQHPPHPLVRAAFVNRLQKGRGTARVGYRLIYERSRGSTPRHAHVVGV